MTTRSRAAGWAALVILHFVTTLVLVMYVFGSGMARFDTGAPPSRTERIASVTVAVLAFPMINGASDFLPVSIWPRGFPWDHLLFLVNSVLWATLLMVVWTWRQRRTSR